MANFNVPQKLYSIPKRNHSLILGLATLPSDGYVDINAIFEGIRTPGYGPNASLQLRFNEWPGAYQKDSTFTSAYSLKLAASRALRAGDTVAASALASNRSATQTKFQCSIAVRPYTFAPPDLALIGTELDQNTRQLHTEYFTSKEPLNKFPDLWSD